MEKLTIEELKEKIELFNKEHKKYKNQRLDLSYLDLSYLDLSEMDFRYADLSNTSLSNANLSNADLSNADLNNAILSNTILENTILENTNLENANLNFANLKGVNLNNANLKDIELYQTTFDKCTFSEKVVSIENIGSRNDTTFYFVDFDTVYCGCWNNCRGGSLAEFEERVNKEYPENNINTIKYRKEYIEAINFFKDMKKTTKFLIKKE